MIHQNLNLDKASQADIKPIFKCGARNRDVVDWVVGVVPTVYTSLINKRTFIGFVSTFPRPYVFASHCRRSLALDHATKEYTKDITCHHCAEMGHERSKCENNDKAPVCLHCGEKYLTM